MLTHPLVNLSGPNRKMIDIIHACTQSLEECAFECTHIRTMVKLEYNTLDSQG